VLDSGPSANYERSREQQVCDGQERMEGQNFGADFNRTNYESNNATRLREIKQ
jgi:hypothetical protein